MRAEDDARLPQVPEVQGTVDAVGSGPTESGEATGGRMTALVETDLEFARRWAESRGIQPCPTVSGKAFFWTEASGELDRCENDLPLVVYFAVRSKGYGWRFDTEADAWDALAAALAELRKAVDVL